MLVSLLLCLAPALQDDPVALRGAWISPGDTSILGSRLEIAKTMDLLYENGFNAVFVPAWTGGLPLFQSPVCESVAGFSIAPAYKDRDPFKELVFEGHRAGLEVFATFENGLALDATGAGHAILDKKPEWAACGTDKKPLVTGAHQHLATLHPEAHAFAIDLLREMLLNYEVDGFCLDGSILPLPIESGYDAKAAALHRDERKIDPPPDALSKPWTEWRLAKLTDWVERFRREMLTTDAKLLFVLSTGATGANVLRDEKSWLERGLFDIWMPHRAVQDAAAHAKWLDEGLFAPLAGTKPRFTAPVIEAPPSATSDALVPLVSAQRERKLAGEAWMSIGDLLADDAALFADVQQGPYYGVATLPWRDGVEWRPNVKLVLPKAGVGSWQWRVDADGMRVLESPGGQTGDASWSFRAPEAGAYTLWAWLSPDGELGKRAAFSYSAEQRISTRVFDPSSKRARGWIYVGRTNMKRHEEREVMRLVVEEKDESKVAIAGPMAALLSRREKPR